MLPVRTEPQPGVIVHVPLDLQDDCRAIPLYAERPELADVVHPSHDAVKKLFEVPEVLKSLPPNRELLVGFL